MEHGAISRKTKRRKVLRCIPDVVDISPRVHVNRSHTEIHTGWDFANAQYESKASGGAVSIRRGRDIESTVIHEYISDFQSFRCSLWLELA